jgi:menaquinone-dependent protoporphyrinogen oxidase
LYTVINIVYKGVSAVKIAIVYDTKRGSTAKIAGYIAEPLKEAGHEVDICEVSECTDISSYDAVVVGSPVYYESPLKPVRQWLQEHSSELKEKPVCLFVVCMAQMFGHPFKSYVYKRYLGALRKALGKEPLCQWDIMGYVLKENPQSREDAIAFGKHVLEALADRE